jgi:multidrug efflux system membrane fusion protein
MGLRGPACRLQRMKRRRILLLGLVLAASGLGIQQWLSRPTSETLSAAPHPDAPVPVIATIVKKSDVPIYKLALGTVEASQTVTVKARVDGQIQTIDFTEGQAVAKGDLIAQIDPRPYQAQRDVAQAAKTRDDALLANARRDLVRYSDLAATNSISKQTLDTQKALVAQYTATVQSDQAQIDYAKVQLDYTSIRAPVAGITGVRQIDAGNIAHASDTTGIVVINNIEPVSVLFTLPQDDFDIVRQAMSRGALKALAFARADTLPRAEGRLQMIDNVIDQTTGTLHLKASFTNTGHTLWPGQFVTIKLLIETRPDALTVPASVVQRGPNGTFAYVAKPDHTVEQRPVAVDDISGGAALITSGLAAGDQVVVDGQYKLTPGAAVTVQAMPEENLAAGQAIAGNGP